MLREEIIIKTKEECSYDIVIRLMKKNIYCGIIRCSDDSIIEELSRYMKTLEIPLFLKFNNQEIEKGYVLSNQINESAEEYNDIYIMLQDEKYSTINNEGEILNLKDSNEWIEEAKNFNLDSVPIHIQNEEIRKMFIYAFLSAEKEIDIISPWMNFRVVNDSLILLMEKALERGVKIRIIYGLKAGENEYSTTRSIKSDAVADKLRNQLEKYGSRFLVSRDNIHYKLLLCDEKYKLEGGFNYLSFDGDYSNPNTRREGSPFGRDAREIKYLREIYFNG